MGSDERGITQLLRTAVADPPTAITLDDLRRGARRRRAVHRAAPAVALVVLAVVGGATWANGHSWGRSGDSTVIAATPTPTSPSAESDAGCPKTKTSSTVTIIEWVDFVQLNGRQFLASTMTTSKPTHHTTKADLGPEIARVTCSISELTADHDLVIQGGFLDGNAAFLPKGTPLYAVTGYHPDCRIAAVVDGKVREYLAQHEVNERSRAMPCARNKD